MLITNLTLFAPLAAAKAALVTFQHCKGTRLYQKYPDFTVLCCYRIVCAEPGIDAVITRQIRTYLDITKTD